MPNLLQESYINNSVTNEKMYAFYDVGHMIKLVRNALGEKKITKNSKGRLVKWDYIVMLYETENQEELYYLCCGMLINYYHKIPCCYHREYFPHR